MKTTRELMRSARLSATKSVGSQLRYEMNDWPTSVPAANRHPMMNMQMTPNIALQGFFLFCPNERCIRIGKGRNIRKWRILSFGMPSQGLVKSGISLK